MIEKLKHMHQFESEVWVIKKGNPSPRTGFKSSRRLQVRCS